MATRSKRTQQALNDPDSEESDSSNKKPLKAPASVYPMFNLQSSASNSVKPIWKTIGTLLVATIGSPTPNPKIAAFDLDDTISSSKRGQTAWSFQYPAQIRAKLTIQQSTHRIVILSNQGGLGSHFIKSKKDVAVIETKKSNFKQKVDEILMQLRTFGVSDILFCASTEYDWFRKPAVGMWEYVVGENNVDGNVEADLENSFFVGDAGGRTFPGAAKGKKQKDFSDSDRKFALNVGIKYLTPEQYFEGNDAGVFSDFEFNPAVLLNQLSSKKLKDPASHLRTDSKCEIVVCVGFPACGKSTFAKKIFESNGYVYVNQDTLKTKAKCISVCKNSIANSNSVVIDNTNLDKETRKSYIDIAKQHDVPIRCFHFDVEIEICKHNDGFRAGMSGWMHMEEADKRERISSMVYAMGKKKFQEPTKDEGFEEVITIEFVPEFSDVKAREKWSLFYS
ncbi:hypothetical protein HK098_005699 [Nowakowskiella sp. JEL0407]|nr:hypothetical protein HK098_005699 [Nowakowskiella sp. JEL0407]